MSEPPTPVPPPGSPSAAAGGPALARGTEPWFRRVTFYGLLAGLCPLIPVPFLDDRVLDWVRRRMVFEQLRGARAVAATPAPVRVLAGSDEGGLLDGCWSGCLVMPVFKVIVYLVRKVFSKILVLLTLNQCVDRFSETFHLGYLLHHALVAGLLDPAAPPASPASPAEVRGAIRDTLDEIDPRPVRQLVARSLKGSRRVLLQASRYLGRFVQRRTDSKSGDAKAEEAEVERELAEDESRLSRLLEVLSRSLGAETGYLTALETTFEDALTARAEEVRRGPRAQRPGGSLGA